MPDDHQLELPLDIWTTPGVRVVRLPGGVVQLRPAPIETSVSFRQARGLLRGMSHQRLRELLQDGVIRACKPNLRPEGDNAQNIRWRIDLESLLKYRDAMDTASPDDTERES